MTEAQIERKLTQGVKAAGGMCMKFISPNLPGAPDRVVLLPGGRLYFVELKTGAGRLAGIQAHVIGELRKLGADARVLFGLEAVNAFLEEVAPK